MPRRANDQMRFYVLPIFLLLGTQSPSGSPPRRQGELRPTEQATQIQSGKPSPLKAPAENRAMKFRNFVRISGAVKKPNFYFFDSGEKPRLLTLIALAGWFRPNAKTEELYIRSPGEQPRMINAFAAMTNSDL